MISAVESIFWLEIEKSGNSYSELRRRVSTARLKSHWAFKTLYFNSQNFVFQLSKLCISTLKTLYFKSQKSKSKSPLNFQVHWNTLKIIIYNWPAHIYVI